MDGNRINFHVLSSVASHYFDIKHAADLSQDLVFLKCHLPWDSTDTFHGHPQKHIPKWVLDISLPACKCLASFLNHPDLSKDTGSCLIITQLTFRSPQWSLFKYSSLWINVVFVYSPGFLGSVCCFSMFALFTISSKLKQCLYFSSTECGFTMKG